jgi:histidinol-phosphate/aromatic aminotransferase/cobyric acid decarboxylase-like protein
VLADATGSDATGSDATGSDATGRDATDAAGLRQRLATRGVLVRDCTSFEMPGTLRIDVPDDEGRARLEQALLEAVGG